MNKNWKRIKYMRNIHTKVHVCNICLWMLYSKQITKKYTRYWAFISVTSHRVGAVICNFLFPILILCSIFPLFWSNLKWLWFLAWWGDPNLHSRNLAILPKLKTVFFKRIWSQDMTVIRNVLMNLLSSEYTLSPLCDKHEIAPWQ